MRKKLLFLLISVITIALSACNTGTKTQQLGTEYINDFDGEPVFAGMVFTEGDDEQDVPATVDVAYKIVEVKNDVLQQLSPWVSSDSSEIVISTEKITSQTITAGLSVSLSSTVGASASAGIVSASIESTWGFTASIEYAVTQAQSSSVSITFPLDEYKDGLDYAVFLTGGYEVYQVFSTDNLTGIVTEYLFVKVIDVSVIRLLSSEDVASDSSIDMTEYTISDFSLDSFKVSLEGEGTETSPYQIQNERDLYAMFFDFNSHYILMNDIYIESFKGFNGITFSGVLDGNGKKIYNFELFVEPEVMVRDAYYGFFSIIREGEVRDLTFVYPKFQYKYVPDVSHAGDGILLYGVLSGKITENSTIDNVDVVYASISSARFNAFIGGIAGIIENSTVANVDVDFSSVNGCGHVGGLIGRLSSSEISHSSYKGNSDEYATMSHYSTGPLSTNGGIVGVIENSQFSFLTVEYVEITFNGTFTNNPRIGIIAGVVTDSGFGDLEESNNRLLEGNITDRWWEDQDKDYYYKNNAMRFGRFDGSNSMS